MDRRTGFPVSGSTAGRAGAEPRRRYLGCEMTDRSTTRQKPVPGPLFEWVKRASWVELAIFAALIGFWIAPGFKEETFIFGLTHGIGYIALCILIWVTVMRREAPYTLLAATLTPVGPLGSVIAIELIERKGWGVAQDAQAGTAET
jgi:hypothetical protein